METLAECIFCQIVAEKAEASVIYQDELIIAFMNIRPIHPGQFMIIPKEHIDHFSDIPDQLACHIITHAQRLSRNLRERLKPQRVGLIVHGYGVAHAHLIIVPQHDPYDITSAKFAFIDNNQIVFREDQIALTERAELDRLAKLLA